MISPFDAWAVKRALVGHDLTDTLPGVSRMLRPVVEHLGTLPSAEQRGIAWQALLCICPFREQMVKAVDEADAGGAPLEGELGRRAAGGAPRRPRHTRGMPPVRLAGLDRPRGVQLALGGCEGRQGAPDARPGPALL
ncbi:MAG TPA: hypothetical protein VLJ39_06615, partial [Tepidisphaeraceae bacterium]|nr:hypothetical protein [Tepidisphaeraceae bacterium]